ncbi:MAG: hypothetical protein COV91_00780 [Candidatus Taylorbacteria bacterium CG11_big_fil_rev_8_21_14_0_20_46_11]|uniref:O-antigen ligase-related domain-containing protein n=1 Tax=Candidatus Taylorbacteria bacterium CG11_big_fil_rev_8_21_14_0_20_46_11 TaxID=1975025 RepID=A0A2H0KCL2_9BACT|nr:MAG: hypothetical protein COV91_00780 [Candidatus Taylorbacteria bacterium CG11_big_fil_rev_8_21_14_0_20_46_11]
MNTIDKTLAWIARAGVFLMPFVPLVVSGSMFFPFITGKNFTFRIIVLVAFSAWLLLALRRPEFRPKRSHLLFAVLAFTAIIGVADLGSPNVHKSLWSNFERMEGYITIVHLMLYFLVASSVLNVEKLWIRFFATSVGVSAFLGLYGMLQLAGKIVINQGGVRLDGTFGNAAYFAGYMLFHIFLTLFLIFRHRTPLNFKWFYVVALFLQTFILYYSATRGAAVGLFGGLLLAGILISLFETKSKKIRFYALGFSLLAVVVAGGLYTARDTGFVKDSPVLSRFASISVESGAPRFMVWGMAIEGFKERPILGWGQESFNYVFNKYYDPGMWGQEQWFDRTHNIFFDWLIAGGLLGLLVYLSMYVLFLYCLWRPAHGTHDFNVIEKSILTGLLAGYFIQNFFVFDNIGTYILFFSILAFMHERSAKPFTSLEQRPSVSIGTGFHVASAIVLVGLVYGLYTIDFRNIYASQELIQSIKGQQGGIAENLKYFKGVLASEPFASQEVMEQLAQAAISVVSNKDVPQEMKNEFASLAFQTLEKEVARAPEDARLRVFLGSFLNRLGRPSDALPQVEKAHELSPTKQTIAFELASTYMSLGRFDEALPILEKAHNDDPAFDTARITYAVGAIYAKKSDLANQLLVERYGTDVVQDDRLTKAYFDTKQYDKVLATWKARVEKEPENGQARVSLAASYLLLGQSQKAIATLEEARAILPEESKEEIDSYISEIKAGRNP